MQALIKKIVEKDAEVLNQYNEQVNNLVKYRKTLNVKSIAGDLKSQLDIIPILNNRNA
ncbi:hypothetical protein D3C80_1902130 [compost metagenome]